jgi:hypothetical protein
MSSLFVALFALVASSFRTRAALHAEIFGLVINSPFSSEAFDIAQRISNFIRSAAGPV